MSNKASDEIIISNVSDLDVSKISMTNHGNAVNQYSELMYDGKRFSFSSYHTAFVIPQLKQDAYGRVITLINYQADDNISKDIINKLHEMDKLIRKQQPLIIDNKDEKTKRKNYSYVPFVYQPDQQNKDLLFATIRLWSKQTSAGGTKIETELVKMINNKPHTLSQDKCKLGAIKEGLGISSSIVPILKFYVWQNEDAREWGFNLRTPTIIIKKKGHERAKSRAIIDGLEILFDNRDELHSVEDFFNDDDKESDTEVEDADDCEAA